MSQCFLIYPFFNLLFHKTILLRDIFTFVGNSPFLIKRLIVEIEIPRSSETSLMVKKGRFCEFMWWEYGGNISKILWIPMSSSIRHNQERSTRLSLGEFIYEIRPYQKTLKRVSRLTWFLYFQKGQTYPHQVKKIFNCGFLFFSIHKVGFWWFDIF